MLAAKQSDNNDDADKSRHALAPHLDGRHIKKSNSYKDYHLIPMYPDEEQVYASIYRYHQLMAILMHFPFDCVCVFESAIPWLCRLHWQPIFLVQKSSNTRYISKWISHVTHWRVLYQIITKSSTNFFVILWRSLVILIYRFLCGWCLCYRTVS